MITRLGSALKKCAIFLLIFVLLSQNTSCSSHVTDSKGAGNKTLNIYYLENINNTHRIISKAADLFNKKFTDIQIKQEVCPFRQEEEYYNKLSTKLSSGEDSDILLFEVNRYTDTRISIPKILQSDTLCDLNDLIKNDKTFNLSDYIKKVLDAGIYKGKRYLIPFSFNIFALYAEKGKLETNGVVIDPSEWSLDYLVSIADKFRLQNEKDGRYLLLSTSPNILFYELIRSSGIYLFDSEKKAVYYDSPEFISFLKTYKDKLYPVVVQTSGTWLMSDISDQGEMRWYEATHDIRDFYTMPAYGKKCIFLDPCYIAGVTKKCRYKKEAFEFIKILLSEEVQDINKYFPVNINSYLKNVNISFKDMGTEGQDAAAQLKSIANMGKCGYFDNSVFQIIKQELNEYITGRKTAEQTAKTINDKVNLYLNE